MTSNYIDNSVDLDSTYISANDTNYFAASTFNIPTRKTVVFGQNALGGTCSVGNFGNNYKPQYSVVLKIDNDPTTIIGATATGIYYNNLNDGQTYTRANFSLAENYPQIDQWLNGTTSRSTLVQIGNLSNWAKVATSYTNSIALKTDGTLWSWGTITYGGFNNNTVVSPTQISTSSWTNITVGLNNSSGTASYAINSNGTLWGWGTNFLGGLGLGDLTTRFVPTQIGTNLWNQVSGGNGSLAAIQSNGTLWAWGYNPNGNLGLSDITNRSSPVQVGALSNWTKINCGLYQTFGIQSNGTLWAWGWNAYGQLGLSDTITRSSPVQVGALSNWSQVSSFYIHTMAVKTDGTLWAWGNDAYGQLGLNTTTSFSSPIQVGNLSNWSQVACGYHHTMAIKNDGTLWAWGQNSNGNLGLGDQTNRSSPVQVGLLSSWYQIALANWMSIAIKNDGTLWMSGVGFAGSDGTGLFTAGIPPTKLLTGF